MGTFIDSPPYRINTAGLQSFWEFRFSNEGHSIPKPAGPVNNFGDCHRNYGFLDEMPAHFRCGDFSLNLLMQVDGCLDRDKPAMIAEIDKFLNLDPNRNLERNAG
jgi:hypothetical protein